MSKKILSFLILIALLISVCSCVSQPVNPIQAVNFEAINNSKLSVHYIDVGQGDSILLKSGDSAALIDAGEKEYADTVIDYIESLNIEKLDYIIATHPHSDHCGGLAKVIDSIECENFITVETDQQTSTWLDVLYAVDDNNINYIDREVGATYSLGEATLEILGPYSDTYDNYNDYSVIVKAVCDDTSFLFTGDAEAYAEKELISHKAKLSADVLKVGHHGSSTSSCREFLFNVDPTYAVISCGKNNDYGHPHKETTQSLDMMGVTTYRTDVLGHIVAVTDGYTIDFFYQNSDVAVETTAFGANDNAQYVGNKNSKKFHLGTCESVENMSDNNKVEFSSREDAINNDYTPCQNCNP